MQMRPEIKPALLGAAGGAIVVAFIGFTWGGWVTGASADQMSKKNVDSAVVAALAPICVEQFNAGLGVAARLTELNALNGTAQAGFVEKGGWATMPGAEAPLAGVARGCAALLSKA